MSNSTRRGFLKVAGAGVAVAGVAAVAPATDADARSTPRPSDVALPATAKGSMVAYIHDVHSGELGVMVEGREVTITDHELVARLAHAIHSAQSRAI